MNIKTLIMNIKIIEFIIFIYECKYIGLNIQLCEISSSHGGEYDVQSCLMGFSAVYIVFRQSN
jgi:hypothetical protein